MRASFRFLLTASLFYLVFPYFIFAAGWLTWWAAVLFCAALAIGLRSSYHDLRKPLDGLQAGTAPVWEWLYGQRIRLIALMGTAYAWVYVSGVGGFGYQRAGDYLKHNGLLYDLATKPWPLVYAAVPANSQPAGRLAYYVAYYLPAGLAGRLFGGTGLQAAIFLWSLIGVLLALAWFFMLMKRLSLKAGAFFFLFGGMNYLAVLLANRSFPSGLDSGDNWFGYSSFPSFMSTFFWAPQHMIPAWILSGMLLFYILRKKGHPSLLFLWSLSLLWSPLLAVGLLPIALYGSWSPAPRTALSFQNLAVPLLLFVALACFYGNNVSQHPHKWLWEIANLPTLWPRLILFYLCQFGLYLLFSFHWLKRDKRLAGVVAISLGILLLLPWYHYSNYNDLSLRACLPAQYVLMFFLISNLLQEKEWDANARLLCLCLGIGLMSQISLLASSLENLGKPGSRLPTLSVSRLSNQSHDLIISDSNRLFRVFYKELAKSD